MKPAWKTVRVFISWTFRDMHAERDYLSRQVFPELRSRCQKRGAEFIGLDLRWGVTEEEAQREGALKICMDEIERTEALSRFRSALTSRFGRWPTIPTRNVSGARGGETSTSELEPATVVLAEFATSFMISLT